MTQNHSRTNKGPFSGIVCSNKAVRQGLYQLSLSFSGDAATAFGQTKPGQFAQLDLANLALPSPEDIPEDLQDAAARKILLRRPFSFCDVTAKSNKTFVDILYSVIGPASLRMTTLQIGNSVSIIGPLGNGFSVPEGKKTALLVIGGMGTPPLLHLAKVLKSDYPDTEVSAFAGATTASTLPFKKRVEDISQQVGFAIPEFSKYGVESQVATDDGSVGYHGLVTDCILQWLSDHSYSAEDVIIYACGPEAMLAQVAKIAQEKGFDCQVSMERMMACGIGLCQSCAVKCKTDDSGGNVYKMCCKDGPVFNSREVVFEL